MFVIISALNLHQRMASSKPSCCWITWLYADLGLYPCENVWQKRKHVPCLHGGQIWLAKCPTIVTHWGGVMHICVSRITNIGSDNGLSPGRRQAIFWINAEILLIEPFGTNFSEIFMAIHTFSFKKMHLNMSSGKWRTFCLGLNVLCCHVGYLINIWLSCTSHMILLLSYLHWGPPSIDKLTYLYRMRPPILWSFTLHPPLCSCV